MATKRNVSKQSKKVEFNFNVDQKSTKKVNKQLKRTPVKTLAISLVVLIIGVLLAGIGTYYITKNDCFEIIGAEEVSRTYDKPYIDEGVKVIAFGKDDSDKVVVEIDPKLEIKEDGSLSSDEVGTFYIIYRVNNFKYGTIFKVQKIRLIHFVEPSDDVVTD